MHMLSDNDPTWRSRQCRRCLILVFCVAVGKNVQALQGGTSGGKGVQKEGGDVNGAPGGAKAGNAGAQVLMLCMLTMLHAVII
jgi:hypothetical protein